MEDVVLGLQRSAGNAAVARLLARAPARDPTVRMPEIEIKGSPQPGAEGPRPGDPGFAPTQEELDEVAGAMGLPATDPAVKDKAANLKLETWMRDRAAKDKEAKPAAEQAKPPQPPDPNDPHQWKQAPGETIDAFLERQRQGLLKRELERTGLTEEQLRKQVMTVGTREVSRVSLGKGMTGVSIHEAVPTPGGGTRVITTIEIHKGDTIKRTKTVQDFKTGEHAFVQSVVEGGEEQIVKQDGDQSLFSKPLAEQPKPPAKQKLTPHTKWTQLADGRIRVDYIDEDGNVVPGRSFTSELGVPSKR